MPQPWRATQLAVGSTGEGSSFLSLKKYQVNSALLKYNVYTTIAQIISVKLNKKFGKVTLPIVVYLFLTLYQSHYFYLLWFLPFKHSNILKSVPFKNEQLSCMPLPHEH